MNLKIYTSVLILAFLSVSCSSSSSDILNTTEKKENTVENEYRKLVENQEYEKAFKKLFALENLNDSRNYAKNEIGFFYENGLYVNKNIDLAEKYYAEAGNENYTPALYNMGRLKLESGNYTEAASIFETIEKNNFAPALNLLGVMYNYGYSYDVNLEKALSYYKKAAVLGNPDAQFNIGQMYFEGEGIAKNFEEAFKWYSLSADQNYPLAKLQLATLYFKGYGVKVDINNAIEIIKPLANAGNPDAIYNLRIYYKKNNDLKEYEYWDLVCKKTNGCDL